MGKIDTPEQTNAVEKACGRNICEATLLLWLFGSNVEVMSALPPHLVASWGFGQPLSCLPRAFNLTQHQPNSQANMLSSLDSEQPLGSPTKKYPPKKCSAGDWESFKAISRLGEVKDSTADVLAALVQARSLTHDRYQINI